MKKLTLLLSLAFVVSSSAFAQPKTRKLPTSINHPSLNLYAPFISADGNAIAFLSDNAEDLVLTPFYSLRDGGDWREPQMFPKTLHSRLNFLRGYALSADGKKLFISTMRSPGVGGFDIWISEWKGSGWSEPVNPGLPINTKANEACPSVTADGNTMYFMRCTRMDQEKADGCSLFRVARKSNGQWDEPVELPSHINTGNAQVPRIMADGEMLIFSSDKAGGKGGMDLYATRLEAGRWSEPVPLDFANTAGDDQYVSVTAVGRYVLRDTYGGRRNELVEYLFPETLRPKGLTKVEGTVTSSGAPSRGYVSVTDLNTGKQVFSSRADANGEFFVYLKEGARYELSVDPEQDHLTFFSRVFDLTSDRIPQVEKVSADIRQLRKGDTLELTHVQFRPGTADVDRSVSQSELNRVGRLVKASQGSFNIHVQLDGYAQDSIRSDPDMTEVRYDSVYATYDEIDSMGQLYQEDTVYVTTTFHNDRTIAQAKAVADFLMMAGIPDGKITYSGSAMEAVIPSERRIRVMLVVK